MTDVVSTCCSAPVTVGGQGTTHWWICTACAMPCDVIERHSLDPARFDRLQQRLDQPGSYDPQVAKVLSTPAPWD